MTRFGTIRVAGLIAVVVMAAVNLQAQAVSSGAQTIALNATLSEAITLNVSANAVNFNLTAGSANNPGSIAITATTTWTLKPNRGNVSLYAFFSNSASALNDGAGDNIPSADFQISDNGGAFAALTNTVPFGGANAGLQVANWKVVGNNKQGTRNDTLNFNINLSTIPNLPAGVYTGTLTLQVQAI
ncbi:MAG TPA: hypothetical protein VFO39_06715 [Candidatus Sulfotelmatobacter sp.]|nr:hypothetical protein [Candidatus Sulfotelmatobacter sp.]